MFGGPSSAVLSRWVWRPSKMRTYAPPVDSPCARKAQGCPMSAVKRSTIDVMGL